MNKIESCGKRIEKALAIRNMKQSELCQRANVPKSSLSHYIKGAYEPKQDKLYAMSRVLDVSDLWLMGYDVSMERNAAPESVYRKLTESEETMLDLFRLIPEKQQRLLIQMIREVLQQK